MRARDDLVEMRVAATNQLSALLDAHWPGAKAIFADVESPISLEFLTRYPTPAAAATSARSGWPRSCAKHGYSGRRSAAELLTRLRRAPAGAAGEALTEALRDAVLAAVGVLTALNASVKNLDRSVAAHLGEHPDGAIFTSLPRSGQVNAAQVLAEWGDCRQAYEHPDSVAALAGCTPVTKESGKHRAVHFRWACNKRFRAAITTFADNSRHASPWAAEIYNDARASGKDHPHAIRVLARAWIRVIWRCWLDGVPYDPATHGAAAALAEQSLSKSRPEVDTGGVMRGGAGGAAAEAVGPAAGPGGFPGGVPEGVRGVSGRPRVQRADDRQRGGRRCSGSWTRAGARRGR